MKKLIIPTLAAALLFSGWQSASAIPARTPGVCYAADDDSADAAKPKKDKKAGTVGAAVKDMEFFNGKPSPKAKFYIYLQSASWCGPCNREMPEVVKQYEAMKKDGRVELILVGHDSTPEAATAFLEKYNAGFAGVLANSADAAKLPGLAKASGIPHATIVDAKGKQLYAGHASVVGSGEWKSLTIAKGKDKAKKGKAKKK